MNYMIMLSQVIPFSVESLIPIVIGILFNTLTVWLSATFVAGRATLQNSLLFSVISYFAVFFLRYAPIPSIPFISIIIIVEIALKSFIAMKFFNVEFREGVYIAGVQMLLGLIITLPIY